MIFYKKIFLCKILGLSIFLIRSWFAMIFLDVEIWEVVYFFPIRFLQHLRTKQQQKCTKVEKWSQGNSRNKWGHSSSKRPGISDHNSSSKRSKNTPKNYIWYVVHIILQNITWRVNFYSSKGLIWKRVAKIF